MKAKKITLCQHVINQLFVAWIGLLLFLDANSLPTSTYEDTGRLQEFEKEDIALAMELLHETL